MKLPKLPTPESVGGRLLYTAGQMREYGNACAIAWMAELDASRQRHNTSGQSAPPRSEVVDDLMSMMGMKK